jgi:predicted RNase H-like HicB family nuclease
MEKIFKERINYTVENGIYVGQMIDIPGVIIQAKSFEELKIKAKIQAEMYIKFIQDTLKTDEPFEFVEVDEKTFLS